MIDSILTPDMQDLIFIFNKNKVQYLVVGAHAVNAYTEARMTKDLDIWVNPAHENASKVFESLKEFGAPVENAKIEDFSDENSFFIIGVKPNRIDILKKIPGLEFGEAWREKNTVKAGSFEAYFLSLDDIIKAKMNAGRPQDLLDLEKLNKVKKK